MNEVEDMTNTVVSIADLYAHTMLERERRQHHTSTTFTVGRVFLYVDKNGSRVCEVSISPDEAFKLANELMVCAIKSMLLIHK